MQGHGAQTELLDLDQARTYMHLAGEDDVYTHLTFVLGLGDLVHT